MNPFLAMRWLVHKMSVALLANAVALAIPLFAIGFHITNAETMKTWLVESNTYENLVRESIHLIEVESETASTEGSLGDSLNSNPFISSEEVVNALAETFDDDYIRGQTEGFIDGMYAWMNGETDKPEFPGRGRYGGNPARVWALPRFRNKRSATTESWRCATHHWIE